MSFGGFNRKSDAPMSEINTTPLVDVMLVLLIIFIITAPIITGNINVKLPEASSSASPKKEDVINVSLDENGQLFFNEIKVGEKELSFLLKDSFTNNPNIELRLNADRNVRYEKITQIMSIANESGISNLGFVTIPK
ncbi:MAG: biopolymer transport protein ExbD [Rickettsiales bacterium]|jgi:biopolymer transport protein ExbD